MLDQKLLKNGPKSECWEEKACTQLSWGSEGREEINVTDVKADTISWCTLLLSHHLQPQKMSKWRILGKLRYSCNWAMG